MVDEVLGSPAAMCRAGKRKALRESRSELVVACLEGDPGVGERRKKLRNLPRTSCLGTGLHPPKNPSWPWSKRKSKTKENPTLPLANIRKLQEKRKKTK